MADAGARADSGVVVVDKPAGWTSHDVVARVRRLAGTRRVGHAGTLDPMATGVLVVGVGKATRLLGHLTLTEKAYDATIRLGRSTTTDDADGETVRSAPAAAVAEPRLRSAIERLTGEIEQVPPRVSAVKVGGKRSYERVREGEEIALRPRTVTVHAFEVSEVRAGDLFDIECSLVCSSGTYIRALARDLGEGLDVGGHLAALRRTRVGPYDLGMARTLERLEGSFSLVSMAEAAAAVFPLREVDHEEARKVAHGGRLPALGLGPGPVGVCGPDGTLLALVEETGPVAKPLAVFAAG